MNYRSISAAIFATVLVVMGCNKSTNTSVENPDATKGAMADSLNREQQTRLALLGRTSAPTRYTEKIDGNRVRVVAINFGKTTLGQCADLAGNLLPGNCKPEDSSLSGDSGELSAGMFRQYSTQVGTTIAAKMAIGPTATESTVYVSRNFLVLEWRRYKTQDLTLNGQLKNANQYFVSAIENGVAIRILFDVTLRTADAKFNATFGIADLAAAFARNEATVDVSYEVLGTTLDLMPNNAIVVTSLKEYLDVLGEFYRVVGLVSEAAQVWTAKAPPDPNKPKILGTINPNKGTDKDPKSWIIHESTFEPVALAYYISGAGVGENYAKLRNVAACEDILARRAYLDADLKWQKDMIEHHTQNHSREEFTDAGQRALDRARDALREIQSMQRALMAEAATLACVRTCEADGRRLNQVCPQVAEIGRAPIDCKPWQDKTPEDIAKECSSRYAWSYEKLPLDLREK